MKRATIVVNTETEIYVKEARDEKIYQYKKPGTFLQPWAKTVMSAYFRLGKSRAEETMKRLREEDQQLLKGIFVEEDDGLAEEFEQLDAEFKRGKPTKPGEQTELGRKLYPEDLGPSTQELEQQMCAE